MHFDPNNVVRPLPEDARRLHAIRTMCGFVENGSSSVVSVFQGDASREWHVTVDHKVVGYGASFYAAIDKAIEVMAARENQT